jgi:glycosyltransferase involved in cell wall biosynthesis
MITEAGAALEGIGVDDPLVSLILTTRDRPSFFETALACYEHQTYPNQELIVVDSGERFPVDAAQVEALGGRLVRAEPGTHLGTKLNLGCEAASGQFCQKMDDDDWYGPQFVETMVSALLRSWREYCRPTVAFLTPFLFFDVARWEIRRSVEGNVPGASFLFPRIDWLERPFRPLPGDEDVWFLMDQLRLGAYPLRVRALEQFIAVRHRGFGRDRGHTWVNQSSGMSLEDDMLKLQLYPGGPEALLPEWAIAFYRRVQAESVEGMTPAM